MVDPLGRRRKLSDSTSRQRLFPNLCVDEKLGFLLCNHFRYKHDTSQQLDAAGAERVLPDAIARCINVIDPIRRTAMLRGHAARAIAEVAENGVFYFWNL